MKESALIEAFDIIVDMQEIQERYNKGEDIKNKELQPMAKMMNISVKEVRVLMARIKRGDKIDFQLENDPKPIKRKHTFNSISKRNLFTEEKIQSYMKNLNLNREQALFSLNTSATFAENQNARAIKDIISGRNPLKVKKQTKEISAEAKNPKKQKNVSNHSKSYKSIFSEIERKYKVWLINPLLNKKYLSDLSFLYDIPLKEVIKLWSEKKLSRFKYRRYLKKHHKTTSH